MAYTEQRSDAQLLRDTALYALCGKCSTPRTVKSLALVCPRCEDTTAVLSKVHAERLLSEARRLDERARGLRGAAERLLAGACDHRDHGTQHGRVVGRRDLHHGEWEPCEIEQARADRLPTSCHGPDAVCCPECCEDCRYDI